MRRPRLATYATGASFASSSFLHRNAEAFVSQHSVAPLCRPATTRRALHCEMKSDKREIVSSPVSSPSDENENHSRFFDVEHRNWERGFEAYDKGFGPLTRQAVPTLLQKAGFPPSMITDTDGGGRDFSLLDVATGPGFVLSAAIRGGSSSSAAVPSSYGDGHNFCYTGLDISQNFLAMAKERLGDEHPEANVDLVEGNAERLPFSNDTFDSIVCNFGILHLYDPDAFLRESFRVLRPGGRLSFSVWAHPEKTEGFRIVFQAVAEAGNPKVALPEGPPFVRFADPDESRRSLEEAGFRGVDVTEVGDMTWANVKNGEEMYDIFLDGTARTRELLLGQTDQEAFAVRALLVEKHQVLTNGGERPLSMPCVISSGRKPV